MADMSKPWAYIEAEIIQMKAKAREARKEINKLTGIAETLEEQASSLQWAMEKQIKEDSERTV